MARAEPRLQTQLLGWLLLPLMALMVVDTAASYWAALHFSNRAHDRSLQEIAREVALHVKANGAGPMVDMTPAVERVLLVDQDDRLFYSVKRRDGVLIGGDAALAAPGPATETITPAARFGDAILHGEPVRQVALWLPYDTAATADPVLVQVAETRNRRQRLALEILASIVLPQLLLIVLAGAVVYVGVSRGLLPLKRLRTAVSSRSHVDLSPIELDRVPGEVRPLVDDINALMLRLGQTLDVQNRFIADAAHQLKTPVSGLKAQIEMALREDDPARVRHALAQLHLGAERLSRLVRQLLTLARNEPGAIHTVDMQRIDLNALAVDVAMRWVPDALKRGIDLGFEPAAETVTIDGDPDRLRELINNLVDNAVRYSREQGRVTVAVGRTGDGQARLSISDDSPTIPVDERERIFERFHRLLGSHVDGSGLGLAIVSEIAALHQARITLEDDTDGIGNTFSVVFPTAASH
ncbi:MAG: sensor histidine kinase N-terminal domain-containing protein [Rhodoferax sp.]|uniref:sensor histidine kinase n=1 Tax=Hydrogenophaga sp. TaxID=1904254 RepID=UPI001DA1EAE5|nr:sensor histidine kinase [Hydrogenophaga sp.]MCB1994290.1 sensor histidine kinase N-terminal domain-containing protein [Rhodoferax sp.]MCB2006906.1 sensor histidine kinase N-terminal domain-containing protein [Rhodoferax sp.]MCB2042823.1 sensor histidine kinase N-terminal domain-containing protein [Rhodoferax sp.]MCP5262024.1 sensor histidine kinase N-terminal domain-containing protein [Rhodoferax sp.]MCW5668712.1 sensor histidine kinase N-terminal domain-containing protein [Hydrogenophaga s